MMKVCIIGGGLTSLTLAKALINIDVYVDVCSDEKHKQNKSRTLGISKSNVDFFNNNISNIEKFLWKIYKIEIYSENLNCDKILNFDDQGQTLFSVVKNFELYNHLLLELKKSKLIKFKRKVQNYDLIKHKYNLIINCDPENKITEKFFHKKFIKDYSSYAYTGIINHKKMVENRIALQTFTKRGPIAFLPISENQTSVVYSVKGENIEDLPSLIKKYNFKYEIMNIKNLYCFKLRSIDLRNYHHENMLAFGDLLHKIHPLAGQGFNMTIRDIKLFIEVISRKIDLGLELDSLICEDFEKHSKSKNLLFAKGIDFIYEVFNLENRINNNIVSKSAKLLGKNKIANSFFTKFADNGLQF